MYTRATICSEIKSFRNRMKANGTTLSVTNKGDVLGYAVYNAYRDMQPRTIKGHIMNSSQQLRDDMAQKFVDYFKNPAPKSQADFDTFHKTTCLYFLGELNKCVHDSQEFGKAQKFVNMAFKYLYCFDDAHTYDDWFKFCHMPIDSYTLNWCFDNALYVKKDITNWSGIKEGQYYNLSDKIRVKLSGEAPLLVEFKIWPQEIAKVEEKELAKAILEYLANNYEVYCSSGSFVKSTGGGLEEVVNRKIKNLNHDRNLDGLVYLDKAKLSEMLGTLSVSSLFKEIEKSL